MNYRVSSFRRSRLLRVATSWVIAGQLISGAPIFAQDTARVAVKAGTKALTTAERKIAKTSVRVNRTVPKVTPPNIDPMFGTNVTTATLMKARVFPEQLIPTSEPTAEDNAALARTLERIAMTSPDRRASILDAHIQKHSASPWRASLLAAAGTLYSREGYFSRAQAYWTQAWELTRDIKTVTDPMDQVTTYTYNIDDSLASTGFTNETIATPDISHTYDSYYPRRATMVDANGTTTYSYVAAGTDGAGQLASVNGPFTDDTISYTYDELGRVLTRMLDGAGTETTYDALGRLSQLEFPIGAFDYTYVGHTGRRASVTYPNDQTTTYSYLDDEHDFRLQTIHHKNPSAATLSKFDYSYDAVGNILTWRQERAGSAAKIYTFGHDLVDQLTSAVLTDTNTTPTILKRQAWAYDMAGNRSVDQTDDAVFATTHDALNRLQARAPGGPVVFAGSLNEAGTVTIDGKPATVDASNNFQGTAQLAAGTTTVTVKAKDASGNETTQQYEVDASGSTSNYTYDANGNLTADGTRTYYWNALNQLVEVKEGTTTIATFEYDGDGRRTEKTAGGITHTYIYDDEDIIEERITGSSSDTIRYFHGAGIDEPLARKNAADAVTYYLADHLGSIVQESNAAGAVTLEREFDPWGVGMQGASTSGYAFTGREWDADIGLNFYRARYYSPDSGRFISDDPSGFVDGPNVAAYVGNAPLSRVDPTGEFIMLLPFVPAAVTVAEAVVIYTVATLAGLAIAEKITSVVDEQISQPMEMAGHKKRRPSTEEKHEEGDSRRKRDQGGEKADWPDGPRRPPRNPPPGHKGPWPPKPKPPSSSGLMPPPAGDRCEK